MNMVSFWRLMQTMKEDEDAALLDSGEESKAMRVVRTGIGLRNSKDCGNFWDDFISICNDGEGLAELLEVSADKISNWASKVKEMMDKVESEDDQGTAGKKATIVPTDIDTRPMP
jgi:hypothetical protein